ncbi:hypothetical protein MMC22_000276 [Lobaria immixta]|nr:hypothetical protein [Lobaria immixta]
MFRFYKGLDTITLFHRPSLPSSIRVLTLLKQASAHASETATEDQASDHSHQNKMQRTEFELNVTEDPPTSDQLRTILEYVGGTRAKDVVDGARNEGDAIRTLSQDPSKFKAPVTVDWNNGRAVIGESESEIMKMISQLPKETDAV